MDVIDGSVDMNQVHLPETWMSLMGVLIWTKFTYLGHGCHWWECWYEPSSPTWDMDVTDGSVDMNQVHLPGTWMSLMGVLIWIKSTYLGHGCHWWECWYEPSPPTWDMDVTDGSVNMNQVHLPGTWMSLMGVLTWSRSTYLGHGCHWWKCWYEPCPPTWDMNLTDGSVDMNQVHLPGTWMSLMGVLIWTKSTYLRHGCHWWECWYEPSPPTWDMDVTDGSVDMNQVHLPETWMSLMGVLIWTKFTYLGHGCHWWECWYEPSPPTWDMDVIDGSVDMNQVHLPGTWMSLMGVLIWTKSTYLRHECHWWECWYKPSPPTWHMDVTDGSVDMNQVHLPGTWMSLMGVLIWTKSTYLRHECHWWECWYEPSSPTWDMDVIDGSVDMNQVHLPGTWVSLMGVLIWTKSTYLGHGCHWWECWYEPSPPTWDMDVTDGSVDMIQVHLPGTWMSLMKVLIWTLSTYLGHECHWWECWYEPGPPTWDMNVTEGSVDMNQVHLPETWMSLMGVLIWTKSTYLGHGCHWWECWYEPSPPTWDMNVTDGSVDMNQVHLPGT